MEEGCKVFILEEDTVGYVDEEKGDVSYGPGKFGDE